MSLYHRNPGEGLSDLLIGSAATDNTGQASFTFPAANEDMILVARASGLEYPVESNVLTLNVDRFNLLDVNLSLNLIPDKPVYNPGDTVEIEVDLADGLVGDLLEGVLDNIVGIPLNLRILSGGGR